MEIIGFILIPVSIIQLVIIYIFNFKIVDKDYTINDLKVDNRILLEENKNLVAVINECDKEIKELRKKEK